MGMHTIKPINPMLIDELHQLLGYRFKSDELLQEALTHRSLHAVNNERLEFLGDAVLGLVISTALFLRHPKATEGVLSHTRAALVCEKTLAKLAKRFKLERYLRLGSGERKGRETRPSLLADMIEAIIGAIYLEGGLEVCKQCILAWYADDLDHLINTPPKKDAKTALQEYLQARKQPLPRYRLIHQKGTLHEPIFTIACEFPTEHTEGLTLYTGTGKNRRQAEQRAAAQLLAYLQEKAE